MYVYINLCNTCIHNKTAIQFPHSLYRRTRQVQRDPLYFKICAIYMYIEIPYI